MFMFIRIKHDCRYYDDDEFTINETCYLFTDCLTGCIRAANCICLGFVDGLPECAICSHFIAPVLVNEDDVTGTSDK